jgi:hypothetical protein
LYLDAGEEMQAEVNPGLLDEKKAFAANYANWCEFFLDG